MENDVEFYQYFLMKQNNYANEAVFNTAYSVYKEEIATNKSENY